MPLLEAAAKELVLAALVAEQGGPNDGQDGLAGAIAKCVPHLLAGTVTTTVTAAVTGAVPTPPSPGVANGTGTGTIGGLVKGDAIAGLGLAGVIMSGLMSHVELLPGSDLATVRAQVAVVADAIAVFADYVMANAQVSTTDTGPATTPGVNGPTTGSGTGSLT